ncbi:MAG: 5-formyltetrahydrofolate cyclo-ligase [Usitatibacteraceae bacterium]
MISVNPPNASLHAQKRQLRDSVLALRDAMAPDARAAASQAILQRVVALPEYTKAKTVLTYMGFGTEIETQWFFERVIADGKIAVLPRVDRANQSLILHSARTEAELMTSKWGIREPKTDAPVVSIATVDFVLMPGVAFDRTGNRLGYGRGYYDKLVAAANPALARVAAGYGCQIVDRVPVDFHDQKVHRIITENEMILPS